MPGTLYTAETRKQSNTMLIINFGKNKQKPLDKF